MRKLPLALLIGSFMLAPGLLAQTVRVNWNQQTNFAKFKTYTWQAAKNPGDPVFSLWVEPDVASQLRSKGLQYIYPGQQTDLLVIYSVATPEVMDSTTEMAGYGWGDGPWAGWGSDLAQEGLPPVVTTTTEHPRTMAILTIDIVDTSKKKIVWRGQATINHLSGSDKGEQKQVQKAVEKMFKNFPPS
jgi:hypothetical protein